MQNENHHPMRSLFLSLVISLGISLCVNAQNQGMRTNTQESIVSFDSQNKGILMPRMTATQKEAISNVVDGLMIYQTDGIKGIYQYNGTEWVMVGHNPQPYQVANGIGMDGTNIKLYLPSQATGDMFYFNGNVWIRIPKGNEGQKLCLVNGAPTWVD